MFKPPKMMPDWYYDMSPEHRKRAKYIIDCTHGGFEDRSNNMYGGGLGGMGDRSQQFEEHYRQFYNDQGGHDYDYPSDHGPRRTVRSPGDRSNTHDRRWLEDWQRKVEMVRHLDVMKESIENLHGKVDDMMQNRKDREASGLRHSQNGARGGPPGFEDRFNDRHGDGLGGMRGRKPDQGSRERMMSGGSMGRDVFGPADGMGHANFVLDPNIANMLARDMMEEDMVRDYGVHRLEGLSHFARSSLGSPRSNMDVQRRFG